MSNAVPRVTLGSGMSLKTNRWNRWSITPWELMRRSTRIAKHSPVYSSRIIDYETDPPLLPSVLGENEDFKFHIFGLRRGECIGFLPQEESKREEITVKFETPSKKGGDAHISLTKGTGNNQGVFWAVDSFVQ